EKSYVHRPSKIPETGKFTIKDAILGGGGFMATNSMVFRSEHVKDIPIWVTQAPVGDLPLMLLLASKGKVGYMDDVMGVYRKMAPESFSAKMIAKDKIKAHHYSTLDMWRGFNCYTSYKYLALIYFQMYKRWKIYTRYRL